MTEQQYNSILSTLGGMKDDLKKINHAIASQPMLGDDETAIILKKDGTLVLHCPEAMMDDELENEDLAFASMVQAFTVLGPEEMLNLFGHLLDNKDCSCSDCNCDK